MDLDTSATLKHGKVLGLLGAGRHGNCWMNDERDLSGNAISWESGMPPAPTSHCFSDNFSFGQLEKP